MIDDYTFLWYDVRPHPNFGTVEIRAMDAQTRVEHTLALAALTQAMVKELSEHYEAGKQLARYPYEMLDENKWLAARHGMDGELVDLPEPRARARQGARAAPLRPPARARAGPRLGRASSRRSRTSSRTATAPIARRVVYEANHDYGEVMREIVEATGDERLRVESRVHGQRPRPLRRLQEVRLGGLAVHHRVPVLRHAAAQARAEARARRGRQRAQGAAGGAARCHG